MLAGASSARSGSAQPRAALEGSRPCSLTISLFIPQTGGQKLTASSWKSSGERPVEKTSIESCQNSVSQRRLKRRSLSWVASLWSTYGGRREYQGRSCGNAGFLRR